MKRIGLLGGTFNPIHNGHLAMAQTAYEKLKLDKVIFIPAYIPVHKRVKRITDSALRYKMVELAIKNYEHFDISDAEIQRKGKSYTIDTVTSLRAQYFKNDKFYFIIGSDNASELHTWKRIEELSKLVFFICMNRPGCQSDCSPYKCRFVTMDELDISASDIRKRVFNNKPVEYLLPDTVYKFIKRNKIYQ